MAVTRIAPRNMTAMLAMLAAVAVPILHRGRLNRRAGIGLLVAYGVDLAALVTLSAAGRP